MKKLIILAHPNMEESRINKRWVAEISQFPDKFDIYDLYKEYPEGEIDIEKEQNLIESYQTIVFQFPLYWFSTPPLLKKWIDEVLTYGWAYGSNSGYKFGGKRVVLAVTAGADEQDYSQSGTYKYTVKELLTPLESTFVWIKANYKGFFIFYGAEYEMTAERLEGLEQNAAEYMKFIEML